MKQIPWNKNKQFVKREKCCVCGREVYKQPHDLKRYKKHFCSHKCQGIWQNGSNNPCFKGGKKEIKCLYCGKIKIIDPNAKTKFCSRQCYGKHHKGTKTTKIIKGCDYCKKEIMILRCKAKRNTFCSRNCANKYHSKRMTASGNPAWRNGIGNLPWGYEFNNQLKNKIKKRDNKVCRLCEDNKNLLIHHIDYNKLNNKDDNLITLCFQCHGKTNYKREFWQNKLSKIISDIYGKGI